MRNHQNRRNTAFGVIMLSLILCVMATGCFSTDPTTEPVLEIFTGKVVSTGPAHITVEPQAGSSEASCADRIDVVLPEDAPVIQNGDMVRIEYDGLIQESYPARIPNVFRVEVMNELEYVAQTYSLSRTILDGYTVMVNGDAVANQDAMHQFYQQTQQGNSASIRLVSYYTIGDPRRMSEELFEESREMYPALYIHELTYDGDVYTLRWFEDGTEQIQTWQYLMPYTQEPPSTSTPWLSRSGYVLTDRDDVTYEELMSGMLSADFRDQIPFHDIFADPVYDIEPGLWQLRQAQYGLEEHMAQYQIASLGVNDLTNRLDIEVYEWVDGLFDLIEQYIDPHFVTVTEVRHTIAFTGTSYNSVEAAIQDGCYTEINGDAVAGKETMEEFLRKSERGEPASIRLVSYLTLSSPVSYDPGDYPDIFARYPVMSVSDLVFDGKQYTEYSYSNGKATRHTFQFLRRYAHVTYGSRTYEDYFVLTDFEDLTFEEYVIGSSTSFRGRFGRHLCSDALFENEPDTNDLNLAKRNLEPHMQAYQITSIEVNDLAHRLDITVAEWVNGVDALVSQYIDLNFVTIVHQNGLAHLAYKNDLATRFPDYFGLQVYRGLEIYALEDGYVLVSPATNEKSESQILAMPRADAAEMASILQTYAHWGIDYAIINRTNRTEYAILKDLGIYPECSVNADLSNVTAEGATITFNIYNLDDKEVWTGQEFQLQVMTENGWVNYGYDPDQLAWDTSLLFHRQGTGTNPYQSSFLTKDSVTCTVSWSAVGNTPLPPGQYRYYKVISIRDGDEIRGHGCWALFDIE